MKNTGNIALVLCIALGAYFLIDKYTTSSKKIGVVQMDKLVYEFRGMKEASEKYTKKVEKWNAASDSLKNRLQDMYEQIRLDSVSRDKSKLARDIKTFMIFKQSYLAYVKTTEENAQEEDKQMTIGVVNQINDYINKFAVNEGYDVILCNSDQQSVGYAREKVDVTQEVLAFANNQYDGVK